MSLEWFKIILFGDSLVQRSFEPNNGLWGTLLANRFQRVCDVIPRGFGGYTSRSGRIVLPHIFPENLSNVEAFIIFFGANDYSGVDDPSGHHVPLEEYSENIKNMIKYIEKIGVAKDKIILISPGPYCDEKWLKFCEQLGRTFPKREKELAAKYAEECQNIAKELGVDIVNIHEEFMKDEDWPKYLLDGVHLSREGSFLVYELLMQILEKRMKMSELLMPYWRDINHILPANATPELCLQKSVSYYFPVEK
ncbi:hypothetical protein JTE90_009923 [Oedothorax gibbosus]|uniref:SGNH hydrolase-type esterase domain-containing protein n=1 Tax=Oedothorax gibbosus TaxID=931172 RepID=A0AAV6UUS4_9ARAC|nr:hypothetical protein JTE90_009923 [Oedothorax gibbosus]